MILLATNEGGLLAGLFLCSLFSIFALWLTVAFIRAAIRPKENESRRKNVLFSIAGVIGVIFIFRLGYIQYSLLYNFVWVEGRVIEECLSEGSGPSYEFEYFVDGKRYTNCHSSGEYIKVKFPNGKYKVRVPLNFPGSGQMDYEQEIKDRSGIE